MIAGRAERGSATGPKDRSARGLPRIVVTFDDAYANLIDNALPAARDLGVPVTIFAVPGCLGRTPTWKFDADHPGMNQRLMSDHEIREAAGSSLVTIGSHSITHRAMTGLSTSNAIEEFTSSRQALESMISGRIGDFAFPYGDWDDRASKLGFSCGYRNLYTLDPAGSRTDGECRVIGRMQMSPDCSLFEFKLTAAGAYQWLPHFRRLVGRAINIVRRGDRNRRRRLTVDSGAGGPIEDAGRQANSRQIPGVGTECSHGIPTDLGRAG